MIVAHPCRDSSTASGYTVQGSTYMNGAGPKMIIRRIFGSLSTCVGLECDPALVSKAQHILQDYRMSRRKTAAAEAADANLCAMVVYFLMPGGQHGNGYASDTKGIGNAVAGGRIFARDGSKHRGR